MEVKLLKSLEKEKETKGGELVCVCVCCVLELELGISSRKEGGKFFLREEEQHESLGSPASNR